MEGEDPATCPVQDLKGMSPEERMAWLDSLSEEAALHVYTYCRLCWEAKQYHAFSPEAE